MALGGGTWTTQNKQLPGSYINFVTNQKISKVFGERGKVAMMLPLNWGALGEAVEITKDNFSETTRAKLGLDGNSKEVVLIREVLKHAQKVFVYRKEDVDGNTGVKATLEGVATAKYPGTKGNEIAIEVVSTPSGKWQVITYVNDVLVDRQGVTKVEELQANDFVEFNLGSLEAKSRTKLTGGTNGNATNKCHTEFLKRVEKLDVNVVVTNETDSGTQDIYVAHVKNCRENLGIKYQVVLYNKDSVDYEGVVNVTTKVDGSLTEGDLVYWVAGAVAGCKIDGSCTNLRYDGELMVKDDKSQDELIQAKDNGEFVLHEVGNDFRVLADINSLTTVTETKGVMFKDNKVIRIIDVISDEISSLFNTQYLGQVPNDKPGRISLWSGVIDIFQRLADIRAIEDFDSKDVTVERGESKNAVVINSKCSIIGTMEQLYMTTTIE